MKLLVIAFNHYDNIFAYTSALCAYTDMDVTVLVVGYGDRFATSSFEADLRTYVYGMNRNVRQSLFPKELDESLNSKLSICLLRLAPKKVTVKNLMINWLHCYLAAMRLKNCFDVIHFNGVGLPALLLSNFLKNTKKILTIHDYVPHTGEGGTRTDAANRKLVSRFNHFFQHYDYLSDSFAKYYRIDRSKVFTVRSGTFDHFRVFSPVIPEQKGYMLVFGRISPYKGLRYLVEAFNASCEDSQGHDLVIAGNGDIGDIQSTIDKQPRIHLIHKRLTINELVGLVMNARYVLCTYTDVTHSAVVVVAYTFGKPVLVHNVGGLSEVVFPGETGVLIDNLEPNSIWEGIRQMDQLLATGMPESHISDLGQHGCLSWAKIAQDYQRVYSQVMAE